jgi:hypothetical protein
MTYRRGFSEYWIVAQLVKKKSVILTASKLKAGNATITKFRTPEDLQEASSIMMKETYKEPA